ncbi:MAG: 2-amino-4-hydroxy-6-hydroxymethyldihydropteridine diphosphokinase [Actinobacteria bacterium]|nr:2-amino-4-hydroxy-6-hydroxymethyldihydropteridine diphosphokinase [Actinomycetota bacterium]
MSKAYVGIGSNLGDRLTNLRGCISELEESDGIQVVAVSSAFMSKAVGVTDQPDFLNGVVVIETDRSPGELLKLLQEIERKYGRKRYRRWGPRTLDADILLYDNARIDEPDLQIPHPMLTHRRFVLEPLLEIEPEISLPDKTPLKEYLGMIADKQDVWRAGGIRRSEKDER